MPFIGSSSWSTFNSIKGQICHYFSSSPLQQRGWLFALFKNSWYGKFCASFFRIYGVYITELLSRHCIQDSLKKKSVRVDPEHTSKYQCLTINNSDLSLKDQTATLLDLAAHHKYLDCAFNFCEFYCMAIILQSW